MLKLKIRHWILILSPIFIVVSMFATITTLRSYYDVKLNLNYNKQCDISYVISLQSKLNSLLMQIEKKYFNSSDKFKNIQNNSSQILKTLKNDISFFAINDKNQTQNNILLSQNDDLNLQKIMPNEEIKSLIVKEGEAFDISSYNSKKNLYSLYRYNAENGVIYGLTSINVPHNIMEEKRKMLNFDDSNEQVKDTILTITFIISLIIAIIVGVIIKNILQVIHKTNKELDLSNENLIKINQELKRQIYLDPLTNLPNIHALDKDIHAFSTPKCILIDIDFFDYVHEHYGFMLAEKLILSLKEDLEEFIKQFNEYDMRIYKTALNQFALLENAPLDTDRYEEISMQLVRKFKGYKKEIDQRIVEINCTISVSLEEINTFESALVALRRARTQNRDYLCYFKAVDAKENYLQQIKSSNLINHAIESDKIMPYFQPIFNRQGEIEYYECLVRIKDHNDEIVVPRIFLDTSKLVRKYADIEKVLILKSFYSVKGTNKIISVNLSSQDMCDSDMVSFILENLMKLNIAEQIIFEILEDENIDNYPKVNSFIRRIKSMGAKIAIDDFGSGYSNFNYILSLDPDYIKIDGSLIKNIDKDEKAAAIVSAILLFAKKLNIPTVAEYIHSKEVYEFALKLGIDKFQGFYLSKPLADINEVN